MTNMERLEKSALQMKERIAFFKKKKQDLNQHPEEKP